MHTYKYIIKSPISEYLEAKGKNGNPDYIYIYHLTSILFSFPSPQQPKEGKEGAIHNKKA